MHPANLTVGSLRDLIEQAKPPCLTITLPVEPASAGAGARAQQARIRLKSLAARAERELAARQVPRREISRLLAETRGLGQRREPAERGTAGLVLVQSGTRFETVATPYPLADAVVVADHVYVKPLLPLVQDSAHARFYLLALAQNDVRLYEGNPYGLEPVDVPDLPGNADDALRLDDRPNPVQFHTRTAEGERAGASERPAVFHGHALGGEDQKDTAFRFCELVENAVTRFLGDRRVPLVIAAAEPLDALYRRANQYGALHDRPVRGNPEPWSAQELHERAWDALRAALPTPAEHHAARLHEALAKRRAATDVPSALSAARTARVETLLVSLERDQWGRVDPQTQQIELASGPASDAEELTNWTATETLRHGGAVHTVQADVLPPGAALGAIYRFAAT